MEIKINEYRINVQQPEGLVVDYKNKKVYIVSDKKEELYEFNLPYKIIKYLLYHL